MTSSTDQTNTPRDGDMPDSRPRSVEGIKLRIFIPLILAVVVLLGSFIVALREDHHQRSAQESRRSANELQKLLRAEQEDDTVLMATAMQAMLNDERMAQAFRTGDREALLQRARPLLETLSLKHKITHFYFHGPDRVNLLRVHRPDRHGDLISRFTLLEAERTGQTASGVERGPFGDFVLRVVTPWRENGQLLGYLELGMEFKDLIREIRGLLEVDFVAAVPKKFLNREQWGKGFRADDRECSWDQFPEFVIVDQTMRVLPEDIVKLLASDQPLIPGTATNVNWNGRASHMTLVQLEDAGGKGFGELFVLRDVTEAGAQARRSIWLISCICVAVSAMLLGLLYLFLGRVQKTLTLHTTKLRAEIGERQRAEATLRDSEQKFLQLAENITDAFWIASADLKTMHFISAGYERIWGRSTESLYAHPHQWIEAILPEDHEQVFNVFARLMENEPEVNVEYRIARPDGTVRWIQDRGFQVRDTDGKLIRLTGIASDITERKVAEEALRSSEASMAAAQRIAHIASWELDLTNAGDIDANPLRWSDEMYRISGFEPGAVEVSNELFFRLVPADEHRIIHLAVAEAIRERGLYSITHRLIRPDGEERIVHERAQISFDAKTGQPSKMVGTTHDITEQRHAEESLRVQAHMLDHVGQAVITTDPGGRITYANRFAEQLYGWSSADMLGRQIMDLTVSRTAREQAEEIMAHRQQGDDWGGEFLAQHRDGTEFPACVTNTVLRDEHGALIGIVGISEDITARKEAEDASQKNQRHLRGLIDGLGPSLFVGLLTPDGILIEVNAAPLAAAGLTPEDVLGKPFEETHWWASSPEAQQQLREAIARAAGGEPSRYDVRTRGVGNDFIDIDFSLQPLRDETGEVVFLVPSASVITERKQAEEALREIEIRLAHAMSMAQLAAWEYDPVSGLFTFSDRYYALHGTTSELEGGNLMSAGEFVRRFVHPDDAHIVAEELGKVLATADPNYRAQVECRLFRRDGELRHVLTSISATKGAAGQNLQIHGANQDITERKQTEEALRTSKRMLEQAIQMNQQVLDHSLDVVCTINAAGLFTSLSAACEKLFGYSPAEMVGQPFLDYIHPEDKASTIAEAALLPTGHELHDYENRYVRKDGTIVTISWSATWSDADQSIFCVGRDCTERKHAEEAQVARQAAEGANVAKSEFLSRMSHELRTPMNAILGFAQVLETEDGLTADQRDSVDHILKGGSHLLKLINEVLDISSIEAGRLTLSSEPIALAELLEETVSLLRPLSADFKVRIAVIANAGPGSCVQADRQRLKQVLLNLLGNAIKYNRPGGSVTVRYEALVGLTDGGPPTTARLSVTDTGAGLSAEKLVKIFHPFERLGAEETGVEGTGLGLVLARRMVEYMGGVLGVESVVGAGTTFWIDLPTAESPAEPEEGVVMDGVLIAAPKISADARVLLYIEDNPSNFQLVTRILARRPAIQLLCAETGTLGLKMAREHHPDLILLDLHLPDSHGTEVLARLAADPSTAEIPVVMLSADAMPEKSDEMLAAGARAFITKPLNVRKFLGVIDGFLELPLEPAL